MKAKRTAKQIAAATKTILEVERKQVLKNMVLDNEEVFQRGVAFGRMEAKHTRFAMGLVVGASVALIGCFIGLGL